MLLAVPACSPYRTHPPELPLPYRQAEDAFRLGDNERAANGYRVFLRTNPRADLIPRAYYKLALAEFRSGGYKECLTTLDEMEKAFPGQEWAQVYELRGNAQYRRHYAISALRWWELAWAKAEGKVKSQMHRRVADVIDRMSAAELARAAEVLDSEEIRELVRKHMDRKAGREEGRGSAGDGNPAPPVRNTSRGTTEPAFRIGCLLPLSGRYAVYGERSRNGIRLAAEPDVDLVVIRDTAGAAATARAQLEALIRDPSIIAVIGPLRSRVADAIVPRAERATLPMILLSRGQTPPGHYVIQPMMTEARQATTLAEYAAATLGVHRFGILHPDSPYGAALGAAFQHAVTRRGGVVVGTTAYAPATRSFAQEVVRVRRWHDRDAVQAVFVPDEAARAVPLAADLRRANPDLILLGSNGWHGAGLGQALEALEGAVFVDGFFAQSRRPATQSFVTAYRSAYHADPDILGAQAYDAVRLVRAAITAGAHARADLLPKLRALPSFDGAAGTIVADATGFHRELFLLELTGGKIREIETARGTTASETPIRNPLEERRETAAEPPPLGQDRLPAAATP